MADKQVAGGASVGLAVIGEDLCCRACASRVRFVVCVCGSWSLACRWCGETWAVKACPNCGAIVTAAVNDVDGAEFVVPIHGTARRPGRLRTFCTSCGWAAPPTLVDVVVENCGHDGPVPS